MQEILLSDLSRYMPEVMVILTLLSILYLEVSYKNWQSRRYGIYLCSLIGLSAALIFLIYNFSFLATPIFYQAVVIDPFSTFIKIIMVFGTILAIWLVKDSKDIYLDLKSEFIIMSLGVLTGGMLLASANNFLTVYLGVEILSILSYVLASFKRFDSRSSEAGLKYSLYGGIASGIMLFGISHIYGVLGSIQFSDVSIILTNLSINKVFILLPAFLCFFVGIGYKVACVPFHMWAPDVYEGSPLPVTAFFSIVPKMAAMAALVRVTTIFFSSAGILQASWIGVLQIIAALTMTVGNITAINQRSVKRMLAYSSISHAGFMLLGVIAMNESGRSSLLFYGAVYLFMTMVAFYITSSVSDKYGNDHFQRFSGLIHRYPLMAIAMIITMFSLAGLPPFSGFIAKFNIISVMIEKRFYELAIIAVLNSVVSLFYYMKIVRLMTISAPESREKIEGFSFLSQTIVVLMSIPVIMLGVFWGRLLNWAQLAKIFTY